MVCDYIGWTLILEDNDDLFSGVLGIQVTNSKNGVNVIKSIEGGLADSHGIAVGDSILSINGVQSTVDMELNSEKGIYQLQVETKYKSLNIEIIANEENRIGYKVYKIDCIQD